MSRFIRHFAQLGMLLIAGVAHADVIADWADKTTEIATDGPNTIRTMALAQSAVYEAVNAITGKYPKDRVNFGPTEGASIDAAVGAASAAVLMHEAPDLKQRIEAAYRQTVGALPNDAARKLGIDIGEKAATHVIGKHTDDIPPIDPYRPVTTPGVYVPTTFPLGYATAQHKPWFLTSASQLRPGPPPALNSTLWARDYNEIKDYGSATSVLRNAEQTEIARFWATALPDVHMGIVRSVDVGPGREITRNARLYAAVTAAMNDAEIAVFDAKYHYMFWRPVTAVRNGDRDDNDATVRDPDWTPLIVTPVQPEYPCAHCIVASTIGAMIRAEVGSDPLPILRTNSNTAPGVTRQWKRTEDVVKEVSNARIWDGVHYRNSCEVGTRMGEQVAAVVASAYGLKK